MAGYRNRASTGFLCSAAVAIAVALSGCAPETDGYRAPKFPFLGSYKQVKSSVPVLLENAAWWQKLEDSTLDRLVALALKDNISLKIATERVVAARAERRAVPGQWMINSSVDVRGQGVGSTGPHLRGPIELGLSWMLDPWGGRRDQLRAAGARVELADAETDAARLLVLYNLSNTYVDLRYQQRLLVLATRNLAQATQTLRQTRNLRKAEQVTRIEVARAEARTAEVRAGLPGLKASIAGRINELAVLAGRAPGQLPPDLARILHQPAGQPRARMSPQIGIPADLLRNRPDIRIAERRYYTAVTEIGVANAALYPNLSLNGLITLNALGPGSHRPEYYFGPSVTFPSLPLETGRARVALRESQARQAHETWKSTTLTAILEVENALLDYDATASSLTSATRAARLYRETEKLTRNVLDIGEATVGDLIDAQRNVAQADRRVADLMQQQTRGFIEINVRLGAGHGVGAKKDPAPRDPKPAALPASRNAVVKTSVR